MSRLATLKKVAKGLGISILVCILAIGGVAIWLLQTESGLRFALNRAPDLISVSRVDGTLSDLSFAEMSITLDGVRVKIKSGKLKWVMSDLLSKLVNINTLTLDGVTMELSPSQKPQENTPYQPWQGVELPIDISVKNLVVKHVLVSSDGTEVIKLDQVATQLDVSNSILQIQNLNMNVALDNSGLADANASSSVQLSGTLDLSARPNGTVKLNNLVQWAAGDQAINAQGSIDGTWSSFKLVQRAENPCKCDLALEVNNALSKQISWRGTLKTPENKMQATTDYAVDLGQGTFDLSGSVAPGSGLAGLVAQVSGSISAGNPQFSAWSIITDVEFQNDTLNVKQLEVSEQIQPNDTAITAPQNKGEQKLKSGQLSVAGSINGVSKFIDGSNSANAKADLSGRWQDLGWPLDQSNKQVNTSGNFKLLGVPENVNVTASAKGTSYEKPVTADVDVQIINRLLDIKKLVLNSGETRVRVAGKLGEKVAIEWDISSPNLSELLPSLQGDLVSQGNVSGTTSAPRVKATAKATRVSYADMSLENLNVIADGVLSETLESINLHASLARLSKDTSEIAKDFSASIKGTGKAHTVKINSVLFGQSSFALNAAGGLTKTGWLGKLNTLSLDDPTYHEWRLTQAVQIKREAAKFTMERTCLSNQAQEVCVALTSDSSGLAASGKINEVDLNNLNPLLALYDISIAGKLNGEFDYDQKVANTTSGIRAELRAKKSVVTVNQGSKKPESLQIVAAEITISQQRTLSGNVLITLENDDQISAELAVASAIESPEFTDSKLEGRIIAKLADLSKFDAVTLPLSELQGSLNADVSLGGTINAPTVGMQTRLQDGQISIPDLGLQLNDIRLNATSAGKQKIEIEGGLTSGKGKLEIVGDLNFAQLNKPRFSLSLKGNNLELMKTPEVYVDGNVDTLIVVTNDLIELSGNVALIQADLDFQLPENAILASEDVVLLGEEEIKKGVQQKFNLTLDLGDKTKIRAQGLDASLVGRLELLQEPGGIMRANGQIDVKDGRYAAYNQKLEIDKGQLIFNGGAVDDPSLLLRAQKTVDSLTAGVSVTGRASSPILQLYSTPSMSDQDVLSVLIFDKRIGDLGSQDGLTLLKIANSLRGDGTSRSQVDVLTENIQETLGLSNLELQLSGNSPSLVAGKQLSSKFYIGYGYGLLDAAQSLVLRYKINKAWSIQGDVGAKSGADIRYQIER